MNKVIRITLLTLCYFITSNVIAQPFNDSCQDARVLLSLENSCIQFPFINATFDGRSGTCYSNDYANTWFSFTAQGFDLDIEANGAANSFITLWDVDPGDPCNDTLWTQVACDTNMISLDDRLTIGRTYYISVAFQSGGINNFQLCIHNPLPTGVPPNDVPCGANLVLADGTCYAGYNINATTDYLNPACNNNSRASVWYRTFLTPGHSRLMVILDPIFTGNYSVFLSRFNNNSCSSYPIIVGDTLFCDDLPDTDTIIFENLSANQIYYLQVASRFGAEGAFTFCLQELDDPSGCGANDDCLNASDISVVSAVEDTMCFSGCNLSALPGPQDLPGTCYYMEHPTVWHVITPDATAAAMRIIVTSAELENPQIALYTGDTCTDLTPVLCDFSTTGFIDVALFDLIQGNKYFLAVSDLFGDEGNYDVCVDQFELEGVDCKLISTLRPVSTSFGSPLTGPYQSGESIQFCYNITVWQKALCNWLQGIAPRFGSAWDPVSFRISGEPSIVNQDLQAHVPGNWRWYSEGSVTYNVHNPDKGYTVGSILPGGWFFTNDAYNQSNPNLSRGDADNCDLESGVTWEVCFTLKVKDFEDCLMLDDDDASIRIEAFADSEIGIYPAVSCLMDQPDLFVGDLTCCEGPSLADGIFNSCNGAQFMRNLNPTNDPDLNFSWTVILPDGVFGAEPGSGNIIDDVITNFTDSRQSVLYLISVSDASGCFGAPATITVNVEPELVAEAGEDIVECEGISVRLGGNPTASGGSGNYQYTWTNGPDPVSNPFIVPDETTLYVLRVTDSRGCIGRDSVLVEVLDVPRTVINTFLCPGDTLEFNGQLITEGGTYNHVVIIGAQNGCDSFVQAIVVMHDEIMLASETITPDNGSNNGTISIQPTGGQSPYSIQWSNGQTGPMATNLMHGMHSAVIRDANNCEVTFEFDVPFMSSTDDVDNDEFIRVFPNPVNASKTWTIENNLNERIKDVVIYDVNGRQFNFDVNFEDASRFSTIISPEVPGLYFIELKLETKIVYRRLLVK